MSVTIMPIKKKGWRVEITRRYGPNGIDRTIEHRKTLDGAIGYVVHTCAVDGYEPQDES